MSKKYQLFVLIFSTLVSAISLTVAWPQADTLPNRASHKKALALRERTQLIADLEKNLSVMRCQLDTLRLEGSDSGLGAVPSLSPKVAVITWITGGHQAVERGKKDGFQISDRLVVLDQSKEFTIVGYCVVTEIDDTSMILAAQFNNGIKPEDKVYILNRENSPYSLAFLKRTGRD